MQTCYFLFAELVADRTMQNLFGTCSVDEFWLRAKVEYADLAERAITILVQFSTTYLSETAFSAMTVIKTKYRNRLDAENAMILAISNIQPRIDKLSLDALRRAHTLQ